jgi:hypothetical protein
MRRLGFSLLILLLLAACSSAPPRVSRSAGGYAWKPGNAYRTLPRGFPDFVDHSVGREEISIEAMGLVGVPYRWGGNTPESGFDCSGLVRYVVARAASIELPRTTAQLSVTGVPIQPDEIASGDLVFFDTDGRPHSHVGIYVGKLRFVDAPSTGGTVRIDYLNNPYWARHFDGIRRVAPPQHLPTPFDTPVYQAATPVPAPSQRAAETASPAPALTDARTAPVAAPAADVASLPAVAPVAARSASPAASGADAFEPPPTTLRAAQWQAREAGATTPGSTSPDMAPASVNANAGGTASIAQAADPIDAAANAYVAPPSAPAIEPDAAQTGTVRIIRASTRSSALPAPTQTDDDPIARFADSQ